MDRHRQIHSGLCVKTGATTVIIMTLSITTFSIMTLSRVTLSRKGLFGTLIKNGTHHIECNYAKCCHLFNAMLNFVMLSIIMLNDVTLIVVMLTVVAP
jgi:hypothetical protein